MSETKLVQLNNSQRLEAIEKLGYGVNEHGFVTDSNNKRLICKYSNQNIHINNAAILPGSALIINANPLTMAKYFLEYDK